MIATTLAMPREKKQTKTVRLLAETADLAYQLAGALGHKDIADFLEPVVRPALEKLRQKAAERILKPRDDK